MSAPALLKKSRLLALAGDPTRVKIFCFMFERKEGCVSDVAAALRMSISSVSHHLRLMRDNGLLTAHRMGNNICYHLVRNSFTKALEELICKVKV